jgi:hypothetical protein
MKKVLCVFAAAAGPAAVAATLTASALTRPDAAIPFPEDYRQWTHVKSTLVGPQAPGFQNNGGYHHFYANEKAMEGYRTGTFPDGSILIDDGLEATEKGGVTTEGPRRRVAVMVKDSRRFGDSQGWGFESFPGDGRDGALSAAQKGACLACHQRAGRELVYSQFRK